jgi:hypothetical protein
LAKAARSNAPYAGCAKGRIGLEFAHETRLECDPDLRDALLSDVIRRSFPDLLPPLAKQRQWPTSQRRRR